MIIAKIENGAVVETRTIPDNTPFAVHKGWRPLIEGNHPVLPRLCTLSVADTVTPYQVTRSFGITWPTIADAVTARIAEVDAMAARLRMRICSGVSPAEMASWATKESEAQAYAVSTDPATAPRLAAEAGARGVDLSVLAAKVMDKANALWAAEAAIAGHAGALTDRLRALDSVAAVCAFDVDAGWPE